MALISCFASDVVSLGKLLISPASVPSHMRGRLYVVPGHAWRVPSRKESLCVLGRRDSRLSQAMGAGYKSSWKQGYGTVEDGLEPKVGLGEMDEMVKSLPGKHEDMN